MAENRCSDTLGSPAARFTNGWGWPKTAALIHFFNSEGNSVHPLGMAENRCSDTLLQFRRKFSPSAGDGRKPLL